MTELIKDLLLPSHLAAVLIVAGIVFLRPVKSRAYGKALLVAGASTYFIFSNGVVATLLLRPLEYRYPPVMQVTEFSDVESIVVLTAYAVDDPSLPVSSRASSSVAFRVLEAARLFRESDANRIIVSGDGLAASVMLEMLTDTGVPGTAISVHGDAMHTSDSAYQLVDQLAGERFFLVSSAGHMPRAMGVFRKKGLVPVAAPTDYQLSRRIGPGSVRPSPLHLLGSDLAINEYAGLLWYRVSGKTDRYW